MYICIPTQTKICSAWYKLERQRAQPIGGEHLTLTYKMYIPQKLFLPYTYYTKFHPNRSTETLTRYLAYKTNGRTAEVHTIHVIDQREKWQSGIDIVFRYKVLITMVYM